MAPTPDCPCNADVFPCKWHDGIHAQCWWCLRLVLPAAHDFYACRERFLRGGR